MTALSLSGTVPGLMDDIASLRRDYALATFDESDAADDPIEQFRRWFDDARRASVDEPNAMTLATADPSGFPSARTVLLKGFDHHGFVFFTNYESRKGRELAQNPRASLVFFWKPIERQICIAGHITRTSRAESEEYFRSRPVGSRLGAWASEQSQPVASRAALEASLAAASARFPDGDIPCPPHWGGYRLSPVRFEFWQGRTSRLHDRMAYTLDNGNWRRERLFP
jgi:pyridoxamine 5'-phosphate oxidase